MKHKVISGKTYMIYRIIIFILAYFILIILNGEATLLANKVSLFNLANTASKSLSFLIMSLYAYESWPMPIHNNLIVNFQMSPSILRSR